ncbi:MAG TPA: hypothetical protein VM164_07225 [Burkholderiales bacterium]|nr:hypothetical protein [Burkholderiales bacterium]
MKQVPAIFPPQSFYSLTNKELRRASGARNRLCGYRRYDKKPRCAVGVSHLRRKECLCGYRRYILLQGFGGVIGKT